MLPYRILVSCVHTASRNGVPLGASGTVNSLRSPAKYSSSCAATSVKVSGLGVSPSSARAGCRPEDGASSIHSPATFTEVAVQLEEYFGGDRKEFTVPLAPSGTPFQLAVWTQLTKIPYGSTVSYGDIARALGKRLVASRAVGLANGANPISIIVPCHRVIGSDGSLTGYGGGLDRKELLLRLEGAGPVTLW